MIKRLVTRVRSLLAGRGRSRREPKHIAAAEHGIDRERVARSAIRVCDTLQKAGHRAYIVGGAVRDLLLGVVPKDFDVATDATPEQVKSHFRRAIIIGRRFRLVHVMFGSETIEVSTFRALQTDDVATDAHGRVLADNVFGAQHEDAARRDFTINALYYDPGTETVLDYHDGVRDLKRRRLRIIGDPAARYREDPVRMLRAVRFAAKLGFEIDAATRAPIAELAELIENVPAARLFDEMLKLLTSGHAVACITRLRAEGLHHGLLPLLDVILEQPEGERFVMLALSRTDERVRAGKHIAPGFLFATLLWHEVLAQWNRRIAAGEQRIPALGEAIDDVMEAQTEKLAIQRRFTADMREIWMLQPRFERRQGQAPQRLLEHLRLRAGYDFLLLRCASGECPAELGEWWSAFIDGAPEQRELLLRGATAATPAGTARRRRRRGKSRPPEGGQESTADA
ncbi:MAG TPA: polynucleotide adenylyltransferase PcnB [Burkholderiaceae bacterium]|nr:polynucleotide adenylyltransferase PcnB [Burkholderiaceae bacterium]